MRLKTKLNTKAMMNTGIATGLAIYVPGYLLSWLQGLLPGVPVAELKAALGAALSYFGGGILKKPDVVNQGIAIAVVSYAMNKINPLSGITKMVGTGTMPAKDSFVGVDDYVRLSLNDYIGSPMKTVDYAKFYE